MFSTFYNVPPTCQFWESSRAEIGLLIALFTNSEIDGCIRTIDCTSGPRRLAKVRSSNSGLQTTSTSHPATKSICKMADTNGFTSHVALNDFIWLAYNN